MKRRLNMFVVGALFLASSALWALGSHVLWSARKIFMAAIALALVCLAICF